MSEENVVEETLKLVEEAHSPKVFNLSDAIKGRAYPKKDVTIFLDDETALEIVKLQEELDYADEDDSEELLAKINELAAVVQKSSLTFSMRGVSQSVIEATMKLVNKRHGIPKGKNGADEPEWLRDYITSLVGLNIISVTNADGEVDSSEFDFEATDALRTNIPASEWGKLVETMQQLTLAGGYFDQLTDAGFLQKS